jgi:membrane-bound lytic murein transglycosylase D
MRRGLAIALAAALAVGPAAAQPKGAAVVAKPKTPASSAQQQPASQGQVPNAEGAAPPQATTGERGPQSEPSGSAIVQPQPPPGGEGSQPAAGPEPAPPSPQPAGASIQPPQPASPEPAARAAPERTPGKAAQPTQGARSPGEAAGPTPEQRAAAAAARAAAAEAAERARLDQLFPRPAAILPRVQLWTRTYSEVESYGGLVHDSEYLDLVYEVMRWPRDQTDRETSRQVDAAKKKYRDLLLRLAAGPRSGLSPEERRVLALFPPGVSSRSLREAADRIRFQRGQADKFRDGLIRSGRWEDHIRRVFRERGLPPELAALPHVESSFNPLAFSHAGAAGLWQFMPSTGRRFLRIDRYVDERFDPMRSSEAAASFLRESYEMTRTWPLALTGWNHGPGGVVRAVRQLGTRDIDVVIDRYQSDSFGFASRNFYCEFLAALDVDRHADRYFGKLELEHAPDTEVVVTEHYYNARSLATAFHVDLEDLRELNLGVREPVWTGRLLVPQGYALRVPRAASRRAADVLASVTPAEQRAEPSGGRYTVRRGDTLAGIAKRFGVSGSAIAAANHLKGGRVHAGQHLRIPGVGSPTESRVASRRNAPAHGATAKGKSATKAASASHGGKSHKVRRGETLSSIARRHGIPLERLAAANNLSPRQRIRAGQVLVLPGPGS